VARRRPVPAPVLALVLGAAAAAGCAGPGSPAPPPIAVSDYVCDDGAALHVRWWADRLEADHGGRRWALPRAVSGSGARYADGAREVWEHQGVVRVTDGGAPPVSCAKAVK